jgi:DNA-binding XRE family transcriptional regulator
MSPQTIEVEGRQFVLIPATDYRSLKLEAEAARLPPLPPPGPDGTYPAVEFSRASLARKIILDRIEADLTQEELAKLARIRLSSLRRVESGKYPLSVATIDKIDRALQQAAKAKRRGRST